jgi:uncharacterized protein (TIGR03437 family)
MVRAVSAAGGAAVVAPGSIATLHAATDVSVTEQASSTAWPTRLGGLSLEVRDSVGQTFLAPLRYVSPSQIDFQVPAESSPGEATISVITDDSVSALGTMQVERVAPGIFLVQGYNMIPDALNRQVEVTGSETVRPVFDCSVPGGCFHVPVPPSSRALASYLIMHGTGFRAASRSNVTCTFRGEDFRVESVGPSDVTGMDEIILRVPDELAETWQGDPYGSIVLSIDGVPSNMVSVLFSPTGK